ncbi:MAG TPA: hypothetical protein PLR47_05215 [Smithellaceae bacterium]|nr:hypothetical protein [Smithellaceae bacterium]HOQ72472.1 hypothetical protein [Smithellaceae bacterium]
MKRDVGDMLTTLIRNQADREALETTAGAPGELPTLGVAPIRRGERHIAFDLSRIRVFRNLHTFVSLLAEEIIEQCAFGAADIMVRRKVDSRLTPELAAAGLDWVTIYVRLDAAEGLPFHYRSFGDRLQMIFLTLQTERWGGALFPGYFGLQPSEASAPPALLFPFHLHDGGDPNGHYYLVEHSPSGHFLRITIEDAAHSRLQLKHIPHRVVDQPLRRSFFTDIFSTAEKIHQGILHDVLNHRAEHVETSAHLPDFFAYLRQTGLPQLQQIRFTWPTDDRQMMFLEKSDATALTESLDMLAREIQLLEDPAVLHLLEKGQTVEMLSGSFRIYFDVSRWGACLNVSFDEIRERQDLADYLASMKALRAALALHPRALEGVRLFVIHHATAEALGLLKAFADAQCDSLTAFFVQYAGIVPNDYLETLMSLPPQTFRFYGLQKMESRLRLAGSYMLSRQFTPFSGLETMEQALIDEQPDFLDAMRMAAGHLFFKEADAARRANRLLLLVEDGGYLAPIINRFCLEGKTLGEVFEHFHLPRPAEAFHMPLADWLAPVFPGSVEHTKNGYDYLNEVAQAFGKLQYPALSIAVSDLKRGPEARACAVSILNAAENILHRLGLLLSRRTIVILGSAGAIGGFLRKELGRRLTKGCLFGVDVAAGNDAADGIQEAKTLDELGSGVLRNADMFIGVTGLSLLQRGHLEEILLNGRQPAVFFISGSTKTVEFADAQHYLQSLRDTPNARIGGRPVSADFKPLRDLQTGILQGYEIRLAFTDQPSCGKILYLLGEGMPLNFLYYGIPREIVDEVMAQLFCVSCGLIRRLRAAATLPPALLAVDREIDANADLLPGKK